MKPFLILFSVIISISLVISGTLMLLRRHFGRRGISQERIHPAVFNFFTTLYAFFIGFAMVTLWSAFLNAKANVTREANALLTGYRIATNLPHTEAFQQATLAYMQSVIHDEWARMKQGTMSAETSRRFDDIWKEFYGLPQDHQKENDLYANLSEASRQRLARAIILEGNLYPPVWVILWFGFASAVFGLYFLNQEPNAVSLIFEFMVIFLVLACLYFIYDIDTPFSGIIAVQPDIFQGVHAKMLALH
jgi:hypothetical protein